MHGLCWIQLLKEYPVHLFADGHLDTERFTLPIEFPRGIDSFSLLTDSFQRLGDILTLTDGKAHAPVSGLVISTGQDQSHPNPLGP